MMTILCFFADHDHFFDVIEGVIESVVSARLRRSDGDGIARALERHQRRGRSCWDQTAAPSPC